MTKKIAVVDIETTGFSTEKDCIVEIGIVELDLETGERTELYNQLVKEENLEEKHKNCWVFENTDMKFDDVMNAQSLDIKTLQAIFDKYPMTAYNKKFDTRFLIDRGLKMNELDCPMIIATNICKLPSKRLAGKYKWPKVQEAYDFFFPDSGYIETHRGCDDAFHEAEIVYELYKRGDFVVDCSE